MDWNGCGSDSSTCFSSGAPSTQRRDVSNAGLYLVTLRIVFIEYWYDDLKKMFILSSLWLEQCFGMMRYNYALISMRGMTVLAVFLSVYFLMRCHQLQYSLAFSGKIWREYIWFTGHTETLSCGRCRWWIRCQLRVEFLTGTWWDN